MQNNYKQYVKPILKHLSPDASMELAYDETFQKYLKTMRSPLFWFRGEGKQEVMTNYIYWAIVDLYGRAHVFRPVEKKRRTDLRNFDAKFRPGTKRDVQKKFKNLADLEGGFNARQRFDDMQFLVKNARLEKIGRRKTCR